jgi:hypothetical protein
MTQQLVVSARGLPGPELQDLLKSSADGTEVKVLPDAEAERAIPIDPDVAVAAIQGISSLLVPFVVAFAAKLFKREPDAKVEVKGPATDVSAAASPAPTVVVIVANQPPEEQQRLLAQHLPAAAAVQVVLPG